MKAELLEVNSYLVKLQLRIGITDIMEIRPDLPNWKVQHVLQKVAREFNEEIVYEGLKQETEKWADELYPKTDESGAETPETS